MKAILFAAIVALAITTQTACDQQQVQAQPKPLQEGAIAVDSGGHKIILHDGKWVDLPAPQPIKIGDPIPAGAVIGDPIPPRTTVVHHFEPLSNTRGYLAVDTATGRMCRTWQWSCASLESTVALKGRVFGMTFSDISVMPTCDELTVGQP